MTVSEGNAAADAAGKVRIDPDLCVAHNGCRECFNACQPHAIDIVQRLARLTDPDACDLNGACYDVCPVGAVTLLGVRNVAAS